jgi:hypothetical protein
MGRSCVGSISSIIFASVIGVVFGEAACLDNSVSHICPCCLKTWNLATDRAPGLDDQKKIVRSRNLPSMLNPDPLRKVDMQTECEKGFFKGSRGHRGRRGRRGKEGSRGSKGHNGARGSCGKQGHRGPRGVAGAKGDKGCRGPTGAKGKSGPTGAKGVQGATGATGPTGANGKIGPTGPAGLANSAYVQATIVGGSLNSLKPLPVQNPGSGKVTFETIVLENGFIVNDNSSFKVTISGTYHIQCALGAYNFLLTQAFDYVPFQIKKNSSTVLRTLTLRFSELIASSYIAQDILVHLDIGDTISLEYATPFETGTSVTFWGVMQTDIPEGIFPSESIGASITIVRVGD